MSTTILQPSACNNMIEVRRGVDAIDEALVELLSRRFEYMDAAARIKKDRSSVRDEDRKAQVIAHVVEAAARAGIPSAPVSTIWDTLVEASISYELEKWIELNPNG
jgi:isochorismate pyruvate lyase